MNKLTILGASGFVGRALTMAAQGRGIAVRAVSREAVARWPEGVTAIGVQTYLQSPPARGSDEVLVHLAQSNLTSQSQDSTNAIGLVKHVLTLGYAHVCFASSAAVYGDADDRVHRADEPRQGHTPYAQLKLECERLVVDAQGSAARFTNLYGPGHSDASVLARILSQIPGQGPLRLRSLHPVRDFCWIGDAVDAVLDWCTRGLRGAFNVGSGHSLSIGALAQRALSIARESDRDIVSESSDATHSVLRVDIEATTRACGWSPCTTLDEGLKKMMGRFP